MTERICNYATSSPQVLRTGPGVAGYMFRNSLRCIPELCNLVGTTRVGQAARVIRISIGGGGV